MLVLLFDEKHSTICFSSTSTEDALSTSEFVLIGFAVLFSSLIQTVTGFGFALLAVPLMSMAVPTETAVVIAATLGTFTSGGQAWTERHHGDHSAMKRLTLAAFVGAPPAHGSYRTRCTRRSHLVSPWHSFMARVPPHGHGSS
jgi:hypothetical protein